ncbi:TPA: phage tail protein, partial [Klebsiella pneumoniae]|nr:phage tail protein [Klebsiella pneumoniae]
MASIKELPRWEDEVYQIARGDKVEGGVGGIANMQAKTLAERTRYLKNVVESIP